MTTIAKVYIKNKPVFVKVAKVGSVAFDPRPGWVLCVHAAAAKWCADPFWLHPDDTKFDWVREFRFA